MRIAEILHGKPQDVAEHFATVPENWISTGELAAGLSNALTVIARLDAQVTKLKAQLDLKS